MLQQSWTAVPILAVVMQTMFSVEPACAEERDPRSGLYAIWYGKSAERFLCQPYITGGQIVLQWADVERQRNRYDFSAIDVQLADFAKRRQLTTIQINGNRKPEWLFRKVPHVTEQLSVQVNDPRGTLMYWHTAHRDAYLSMLRALAAHLEVAVHKESLLGIRMNLNALGTEHHHVPKPFADPERWILPEGTTRSELVSWGKKVDDAYVQAVVDAYIACFRGNTRIFVRNSISEEIMADYQEQFSDGTLSWFHTSSEVEPRAAFAEKQYRRFYDYCRSGKTTAYAEPWASAWGDHGGRKDDRWCSPPQWNYWRLLFDLHCGVSYIALYSSDMRVAIEGKYHSRHAHFDDPGGAYQAEFAAAFRFASKYAGYHTSPQTSPGAWVAFRENHVVRAANGMPARRRQLSTFVGDYNFLMKRVPGDQSQGLDIVNVGPDEQRYGAWARVLPAGQVMQLALDADFAASLDGARVTVRVVYLDTAEGAFDVLTAGSEQRQHLQGSGRWRELRMKVPAEPFRSKPTDARIRIRAVGAPIHLHMVEVQR